MSHEQSYVYWQKWKFSGQNRSLSDLAIFLHFIHPLASLFSEIIIYMI
jgi:hypothetical protein